jgi:hypothetical protein
MNYTIEEIVEHPAFAEAFAKEAGVVGKLFKRVKKWAGGSGSKDIRTRAPGRTPDERRDLLQHEGHTQTPGALWGGGKVKRAKERTARAEAGHRRDLEAGYVRRRQAMPDEVTLTRLAQDKVLSQAAAAGSKRYHIPGGGTYGTPRTITNSQFPPPGPNPPPVPNPDPPPVPGTKKAKIKKLKKQLKKEKKNKHKVKIFGKKVDRKWVAGGIGATGVGTGLVGGAVLAGGGND